MTMEPGFEKANEIYFRLGIIYKQQQKYDQSLEVGNETLLHFEMANMVKVLQIHCPESTKTVDRGGHLVSDWPCA